ncbi:CobW family GTP-binding protein [Telmatospirillum siberiense]|nr:GTP-binding protein [Telmatospirillum siberiense]
MRVHLIFGFLGAGKTTLLLNLLRNPDPNGPTAVIVNEFGEAGVDGAILRGTHVDVLEYASGCFCCSLKGALLDGLRELRQGRLIVRVFVEASGVAQAEELIAPLADGAGALSFAVGPSIAVFDAARYDHLSDMLGEFLDGQIRHADVALLNKIDLVPADAAEEIRRKIAGKMSGRPVFCAVRGDVDAAFLLEAAAGRAAAGEKPGHGVPAGLDGVSSAVLAAGSDLKRRAVEGFFRRLPPSVWRAKGFLTIEGIPMLAQYVPGQLELTPAAAPDHRQLILIGRGMDQAAIAGNFAETARSFSRF